MSTGSNDSDSISKATACQGCGVKFPSRNAVFRHLKDSNGSCLSPSEHAEFAQFLQQKEREKVILLFGYLTTSPQSEHANDRIVIQNGSDAAQLLLQVLDEQINVNTAAVTTTTTPMTTTTTTIQSIDKNKINRSYGATSRGTNIAQQDNWTSAVSEVLMTRLPPLLQPVQDWIDSINQQLQQIRLSQNCLHTTATRSRQSTGGSSPIQQQQQQQQQRPQVRLLGRLSMPGKRFNAEMDVTTRRVEYLLPVDILYGAGATTASSTSTRKTSPLQWPRHDFFAALPQFDDTTTQARVPQPAVLDYLLCLKKLMQRLTTHNPGGSRSDIVVQNTETTTISTETGPAVISKKDVSNQQQQQVGHVGETKPFEGVSCNNKGNSSSHQNYNNPSQMGNGSTLSPPYRRGNDKKKSTRSIKQKASTQSSPKKNLLQRRRFHNFTPTVMAHEYLAYRRMDRLYHRATLRFQLNDDDDDVDTNNQVVACHEDVTQRPFIVLSVTGDIFLHGQVCRVIGLFVALARGLVNEDFIECVFDEEYGHLVATPPAPTTGMYAADVGYSNWEGKVNAVLCPRLCDRFDGGWKDTETLNRVNDWKQQVRQSTAQQWMAQGVDDDNRLTAERIWTEHVLEPWAKRARQQLEEYRQWKGARMNGRSSDETKFPLTYSVLPSLESVDPAVPQVFEKVLYYLRQADTSGLWPTTTPKRQLVMMSNVKGDAISDSSEPNKSASMLSNALIKAKSNKEVRSSAYAFIEGQGGASGSFSVGAMPGERCIQPKANELFPELMKAAFELEIALCPNREPSSTIAVNRNAQFRPHTDVGAGAGQSTSLIVGLGLYAGGELVVEGEKRDIRYKAVEFNGWKQRHWTMPFRGERFSLVWFTPKGCEGVRGIDLCK